MNQSYATPSAGRYTGWLFVAPFLACYAVMLVWPLARGMWLSLNAVDLLSNIGSFVGLRNFVDLVQDEIAVRVFFNTLLFAAICTPMMIVVGLALALVLNRRGRTSAVLRGIFFGASVLSVTVVTLIWRLVLMPDSGLLANTLKGVGVSGVALLNSEWLALPTVAIVTLWWGVGFPMMLFLAALQQIPADVYEAAALDNTSRWRSFRHITLPAIRHIVLLVAITQVIGQLQVFGQVQLLTQGGPNHSTRSLVMFVFEAMFDQWAIGYAAAAAQVLFALLLGCVFLQQWIERRQDRSTA